MNSLKLCCLSGSFIIRYHVELICRGILVCYGFREVVFPNLYLLSSSVSFERDFFIEKKVHSLLRNHPNNERVDREMFFRYNKDLI